MKKLIIFVIGLICIQCNCQDTNSSNNSKSYFDSYNNHLMKYYETKDTTYLDSANYILDLELQKNDNIDLLYCTRKVSTLILMNKFTDAIIFVEKNSTNVYYPMGEFYKESLLLRLKAMNAQYTGNENERMQYLKDALNCVLNY